LRIAFYAPLKPPDHPIASGDRTVGRGLMQALQRAGHDVAIASRFRSFDAGDTGRQARLEALGTRMAGRLIRRFERSPPPDLWFTYHLYHKAPDWLGPSVAERLGIPYCLAEASYAPKQAGGAWDRGHQAVADAIQRADRVFELNPADAECVRPLLTSPERLVRLPPFLDTALFRAAAPEQCRTALARRFGLDLEEPWLFTAAMMRPDQKLLSFRCLASALARLPSLSWRLIVAGSGPAEPEIREAFAALAGRVCWLGELDPPTLRRFYAASDLYVWPAIKEAYGMALLEAQAAGLPVIAGRSGGVASVVADGESGLLTPEGDSAVFAAAVALLLTDPDLRGKMRSNALARTARDHDVAVAAGILDRHLRAAVQEFCR
jgi:glycosyltransferase involved in cell wall biosynthesis